MSSELFESRPSTALTQDSAFGQNDPPHPTESENGVLSEEDRARSIMGTLYKHLQCSVATQMSRMERAENNYKSSTLVYGESEYDGLAPHLKMLYELGYPRSGGRFVDLGCGTGKAIFAAALTHNFEMCIGIEILESLYTSCTKVLQHWRRIMLHDEAKSKIEFQFVHGDFTAIDWSDADVVFANSTCYDDALMDTIARLAEKTRAGTFFLNTTTRLPSNEFELLFVNNIHAEWGEATIFIQRRL